MYSENASLARTSPGNLEFHVDVQLLLDDGTVSGTVLGAPDAPFTMGSGVTSTGLFDGTPPLAEGVSGTSLVTSAGRPVHVPEGQLRGCRVSFVPVRTYGI